MKQGRQRKKHRFFAAFLCFCVLLTMPGIQNVFPVVAAGQEKSFQQEYIITAFDSLSEDVKVQTVFTGTDRDELNLPEELAVYLLRASSEQKEEESEQENTGGTDNIEDNSDIETENEQDSQPEESKELEETDETAVTDSEEIADTEDEESGTGESAPSEEQEEAAMTQEVHTVTMPEYYAENVISVQTLENVSAEEQDETVAISGITWQSEPEYDGSAEGTYTFTAVLPDGYALADGVSLPKITVTVENGADAVIQALHDRIAALPEVEEYLATEPDMEDEDAYAEWEEKLYEYAEEALAIWGEYEVLKGKQTQISEEELEKLTAWVELAETLSDNEVMLADYSEHHGEDDWTALSVDITGETTLSGEKYYLSDNEDEGNITMGTITIDGDVTLCLNGQTLTHFGDTGSVIVVKSGSTFTLCDCKNDTGCITGGRGYSYNGTLYGGGVFVDNGATFNMYGGVITGNTSTNGGGVDVAHGTVAGDESCVFNMYGGKIVNNTAVSGGGGVNLINCRANIVNGTIEGNTAWRGGGIFANRVNLTMSNVSVVNNIASNSNSSGAPMGAGIYFWSGTEFYIDGKINITGNVYENDGKANNVYIRKGIFFNVTDSLKSSSIGVTAQTPPTPEKPTPIQIAGGGTNPTSGNTYSITPADWSHFFSDDDSYEILLDETNNRLLLCLPGTCDLGGLDLSARGATLSPEFKADTTEYTSTVANNVNQVGIMATLASTASGADIKIKINNDAETSMDSGVEETVPLEVGENTIAITVTSGEMSKVYTLVITREEAKGNPVTITAYKDSEVWRDNPHTYKLSSDNGSTVVTDLDAVPDGTYHIYDGDTDTGVTIKVEGAAATAKVDYYTVTFYDGNTALTAPVPQIILKGATVSAPTDNLTKTGYTFEKWVTADGGSTAYDFTKAVTGKTSVYASWTPQTYQVTFNYHGADGGNTTQSKNVTYDSTYGTLPTPSRTGYTFKGWYTEENGQGSKVDAGTTVTTTSAHTLHAYWKDETAPDQPVLQDGVTLPAGWTNTQDTIPLKLYDGVGVTELWVSVGGKDYIKVDDFSGGTGSVNYSYAILDGEHTYQFKAVDAADNVSGESAVFTVKLDQTKPVIGTITYENKAANLWQWIIGKKSMIVHVPVTDTGSGVKQISYTLTPRDAAGNPDSSKALEKTATVKDGEAKITFADEFRGTITINCTDAAGNKADSVIIGKDAGGVIVEDKAPDITTDTKTGYYDAAAAINVTVKDDTNNAVTAGIAAITYKIGESAEKSVSFDTSTLQALVTFTIPASEIPTGITEIKITAKDNAGNEATKSITVKVKGPEKQPAAEIDYREEELTGLVPNGVYSIDGTKYTADRQGHIPIIEGWFGNTVSIVKKGNGNETTDSPAQSISVPARPAAPDAPELSVRDDKSITLKTITGAQYRRTDRTGNWQDSTAFTGLAQKTIYKFKAYYPATDTSFASLESGEVQIATMPTAPTKDKLRIGYAAETLTLTDGIEAFTDSSCITPVTAGSVEAYMGQTLYIRYPVKGIIPASLTTAVFIPARPAKPAPGRADASYPGAKDGAITGLTSGTAYEYRVKDQNGSFGVWKDALLNGTRIDNLPAGEYEVRVKAVEKGNASFRSEAAAVIIRENPGVKITFMANGEECAIRYTRSGGTLTDIPSVPPKKDAGAQVFVGEWCADEQGSRPAVFTNINADMTVYAVYTEGYTVTLRGGTGYTLSAVNGSVSPVKEGGSFTFRFALAGDYQKAGSFAVKVNGVGVELTANEPYIYTITDIKKNQVVTVEGVAKRPDGGSFDPPGGGDNEDDSEPAPPPTEPPVDTPQPVVSPQPTPQPPSPINPPEQLQPTDTPDSQTQDKQESESISTPSSTEKTSETEKEQQTERDGEQTVPASIDNGKIAISGEPVATGNVEGMTDTSTVLTLGNGAVIVTVVCAEQKHAAGVADTIAVANAVLTPEQLELVNNGETIEIRIDVKDISNQVPEQDMKVIENGIEEYQKEVPGLTLGMYIDISMFIKIGEGDWNAITATDEPIEIIIGIPEKLQEKGREYVIIRAHDGVHTFMDDMDDDLETITVSTDLFSSYAIAYVQTEGTGTDGRSKCSLCHICPTFLGICYFMWLTIIILIMIVVIILLRKKKEEQEDQDTGQ